jgi:hypothetical protein
MGNTRQCKHMLGPKQHRTLTYECPALEDNRTMYDFVPTYIERICRSVSDSHVDHLANIIYDVVM